MPMDITRRSVLYSTAAIATSAGVGVGNASGTSEIERLIDFDPSNLTEIRRAWNEFSKADERKKSILLNHLKGDKKEAFVDAGKERYRAYAERLKMEPKGEENEEVINMKVEEFNDRIPEKWGWEIDGKDIPKSSSIAVKSSSSDVEPLACQNGRSEHSDVVESVGFFGPRYKWEHTIEWDWELCFAGDRITVEGVSNGINSHRVVESGSGWSFDGVVSESEYYDDENDPTEYYSDKKVQFSFFDVTYDDEYPYLELRGNSGGSGTTIDAGIDG